jgi:translation initiation factor 3 subunit E
MAQYDLSPRLIPFLDRHMVLPLLDFLQSMNMYSPLSLIQARVDFASTTKMVDLYQSEYRSLHQDQDPPGLEQRFDAVYAELRELQAAVGELLHLLQDEVNAETGEVTKVAPAMSMREEGHWTVEHLAEQGIGLDAIEALFRFAKLNFEIGRYREAADYLFYYRELMKGREEEKSYWALWGKLAGEVLMANMDTAWADLQQLYTLLESKFHLDQLEQLQQRTWIIHWSLFIFFNLPNGKNLLIDFLMQDKSERTTTHTTAHHLGCDD